MLGLIFPLLAQQNSSINPEEGGIYGPFSKKQNRSFFDAASLLEEGEFSPVLSSPGNNFSIIQLVDSEFLSHPLASLDRVYVQIESILIKKTRMISKSDGIDGLF